MKEEIEAKKGKCIAEQRNESSPKKKKMYNAMNKRP